jgi:hypothetical protein
MENKIETVFCLDCGKPLESLMGAVFGAYTRKTYDGEVLGFVCDECHDKKEQNGI